MWPWLKEVASSVHFHNYIFVFFCYCCCCCCCCCHFAFWLLLGIYFFLDTTFPSKICHKCFSTWVKFWVKGGMIFGLGGCLYSNMLLQGVSKKQNSVSRIIWRWLKSASHWISFVLVLMNCLLVELVTYVGHFSWTKSLAGLWYLQKSPDPCLMPS